MSERPDPIELIRRVSERRERLSREREETRRELKRFVKDAHRKGVPVSLIASEAKISRQAVYDLLAERRGS